MTRKQRIRTKRLEQRRRTLAKRRERRRLLVAARLLGGHHAGCACRTLTDAALPAPPWWCTCGFSDLQKGA